MSREFEFCLDVEYDDIEAVREYLDSGGSICERPDSLDEPLHMCKSAEMAKLLVHYKADVNHKGQNLYTPLENACLCGHTDVAKFLLHNADVRDKNMYPFLYCSCVYGHTNSIQCLIECGLDVNRAARCGQLPIHMASNEDVVNLLIANGADPMAICSKGWLPVEHAFYNKRYSAFSTLVPLTQNIDTIVDSTGMTLLHCIVNSRWDSAYIELVLNKIIDELK